MLKQNWLPLLWIASACALVAADQKETEKRAESPVMAYRYNADTGELRALLGVPGAARWSDPLAGVLPEGVTAARIAPGHTWALVAKGADETGIVMLETGAYKALAHPIADLDRVVFSPSAKSMAAMSDTGAVVFTGLPDQPVEARQESAGDGVYALSDSGVSAAVREGRVMRGGSADAGACVDCVFAFGAGAGDTLVIFSKATGELSEFGATESHKLASGVATAERIAVTGTGVLLLSRESLRLYNRQSGELVREEALYASPWVSQRVELMRQRGDVLFAFERGGASWMLSSSGEMKVIPATAAAAAKVEE